MLAVQKVFAIYLLVAGGASPNLRAQGDAQPKQSADVEVRRIMKDTLNRGVTMLPGGIRAATWIPPADQDVAAIKSLGQDGIAPLGTYLTSDEPRIRLLAVRFLGVIGGEKTVPLLAQTAKTDTWVTVRTQALSSLMNAPANVAVPVIESVFKTDHDPAVQQRSKQVLAYFGVPVD